MVWFHVLLCHLNIKNYIVCNARKFKFLTAVVLLRMFQLTEFLEYISDQSACSLNIAIFHALLPSLLYPVPLQIIAFSVK